MSPEYRKQLKELAPKLVTPERFGQLALAQEVANVNSLYPDLPQAAIHYFPDRSGE